jgi:glycosyltransferase involved in cell wall biosynthesis
VPSSGPALHIGVDGRELGGQATGVGRYVREVLRAWERDPAWPHRVTVFTPAPGEAGGTLWEQRRLPALLRRSGVDVLFAPAYTAPVFSPCPFVVVIHDVSFFARPDWFGRREGVRRRILTRMAARRAARVISVSEFSASEIVRYLRIARHHIVLAPPAVSIPAAGVRVSPPIDTTESVVLYVGSLFNRRRIPLLIEGFALAARHHPSARLVLAGDNRTSPPIDPAAVAHRCGVGDRVRWLQYVPDGTLEALYESARILAFLSDYEGFGIPPLEGLARGVPPLLLDTPVSREVYGEAATLVAPTPAAVGAGIAALLSDVALRAERLRHGRALLERFTWPRTAAVVRETLEAAVRR